jgi:hypothetical protein
VLMHRASRRCKPIVQMSAIEKINGRIRTRRDAGD